MAGSSGPNWEECLQWFARIRLISTDHVLNERNGTKLTDFCKFLRDGVLLCKLLHILDPDSIDLKTINQRPQNAQSLCLKNIGIFLLTCTKKFDLNKDDLFEPHMLFEFTDFGRVLTTLSKLSKCPKAQRLQIEGFPTEKDDNPYDQIYLTLHKDMANGAEADSVSNMRSNEDDDVYSFSSQGLHVYEELKLGRSHPNQWDPNRCDEHFFDDIYCEIPDLLKEGRDMPREKRDRCLQELVETESNYVEALEMLCAEFVKPLRDIIGEEQCKKIFCNIPELAKIHKNIHQGLKKAQNKAQGYTVSRVMLENQEKLLIYGEYCANLRDAQQELENVMTKNEFARNKIQERQDALSDGRYQLRDYLVVPLQRILKYHLLLKELIRHTTTALPQNDLENLKKAHECMEDVSDCINEVKRDSEMLQMIRDVQMNINDLPEGMNDWKQLGKFRRDGEIRIECHPEQNKKRFVFIFDKVLVMCKQTKEEKFIFKDFVKLEKCKVENNVPGYRTIGGKNKPNSFMLYLTDETKAYTIITKDSDTKDSWMKSITDAINDLNPHENQSTNHAFAITTFEEVNKRCSVCQKLLKGTIFQGYECGKCKKAVHMNCLSGVSQCPGCVASASPPMPPVQGDVYWRQQVQDYPWWADRMSREEAERSLGLCDEGTFLLRWSERHDQPVLSLRAMGKVKHMRVYQQEEGNFYLSEVRCFGSIVELINYYRQFPLSESFTGLECILKKPLYDMALVRFPYEGSGPSHLALVKDQLVVIISREGQERGWWKGRIGTRVGYFPKEYVTISDDPMGDW